MEKESARLFKPLKVVGDCDRFDGLDSFKGSVSVDSGLELPAAVAILSEKSAFGAFAFLTSQSLCLPSLHDKSDLGDESAFHHVSVEDPAAKGALPKPRSLEGPRDDVDVGARVSASMARDVCEFACAVVFDRIIELRSFTERGHSEKFQ